MTKSLIVNHPEFGELGVPLPADVDANQESAEALLLLIKEIAPTVTIYWYREDDALHASINFDDAIQPTADYLGLSSIAFHPIELRTIH